MNRITTIAFGLCFTLALGLIARGQQISGGGGCSANCTFSGTLTTQAGAYGNPALQIGASGVYLYASSTSLSFISGGGAGLATISLTGLSINAIPLVFANGGGTAEAYITNPGSASGVLQFGAANAASPVNQTILTQGSRPGTDTNVGGGTLTIASGNGTGTGTPSTITFQVPVGTTTGTGTQALTTAMTINGVGTGATPLVGLPAIASDATHTDASICEDTTTHALYSGSGTLGICLGTSSERYKHDIAALPTGLLEIMRMQPVQYRLNADHGDPSKLLYGFTAEREAQNLPALTGTDNDGKPNTFDYLGVVPVLVRALQEQQAEIESLKARIR